MTPQVYEAVSSSTFFGLEEFVGVTCLGEMMTKLPEPIKDSYDDVDFASIQSNIMKYVVSETLSFQIQSTFSKIKMHCYDYLYLSFEMTASKLF